MRGRILLGAALLALLPAAARAQQSCDVRYDRSQTFGYNTPSEATYMGGNVVITCAADGRVIKADSIVMLKNGDQRLLYGHAYYSDKEKTLTADQINYQGVQQHMLAMKGPTAPIVTLVDKVNGATMRGDFMDYTPAHNGQESHTVIYGGRPHAVLHGKSQPRPPAPAVVATAAQPAAPDSTGAPAAAAGAPTTPGAPAAQDTAGAPARAAAASAPAAPAGPAARDAARSPAAVAAAAPSVAPAQPTLVPPTASQPVPAPAAAPAAPAAPQPADTAATLVDADRMEITGQKAFHAIGNVVITRADMKATSQEAFYDPDTEHLKLNGNAHVTGDQFTLTGGTVDGTLSGNEFRDVTATYQAELQSKDLRVKSPAITVSFDKGQVQRLVALSAERAKRTATDGKALAEAFARDFHLLADSIDAKAPGQKLEQVVAVGHAYGERQNDSIKVKMPEIASKDWLRGDTITGYFTDAPPKAKADTGKNGHAARNGKSTAAAPPKLAGKPIGAPATGAAPGDTAERVLERIVAVGDGKDPASSLYRITDAKKPDAAPAISYALAKRIVVAFRDGQVGEVTLEGEVRGIHLEPQEPKKKPSKDTKATPAKKVAAGARPGAGSSK